MNINRNRNRNAKNLFKTSHAALILNRFSTSVFMFPLMFVICKIPDTSMDTAQVDLQNDSILTNSPILSMKMMIFCATK